MVFSEHSPIKRAAIYFFYDTEGIVDDYNIYLLHDLQESVQQILVVCNGKLTDDGKAKFESIGCKVLVRENFGFDVWAYKEALTCFGWDKIVQLDELVLLNFTIFGPFRPFREMFQAMNPRDLDFWGITLHHGAGCDPWGKLKYGYLPMHLQSHFLVIRNSMLKSAGFKTYWDEMPPINEYDDAVCYHEAIFTKTFEDEGFKWQAYVDTSPLKDDLFYPLMMMPAELLKHYRCPIIKRKNLFLEPETYLQESGNEAGVELLDYIRNHTDYDMDLIWQNLLRTQNCYDLKNCLGLDYVLPGKSVLHQNKPAEKPKVALILHIYALDLADYILDYAKSMPPDADIYITTNTKEKQEKLYQIFGSLACNKLEVRIVTNRGRDVSALLVGCKDVVAKYDYVCYAHDKKPNTVKPSTIGQSFSYECYECVLHSREYVQNVLNTFAENPHLGLLIPPPPHYGVYYPIIGREWTENFSITQKIAQKLGLHAQMDPKKPPIAPLGSIFWFRGKALEKLFAYGWNYDDFHEEPLPVDGTLSHGIERVYPFVAQDAGYYSAWVMPDNYAQVFISNLYFYLRTLNISLLRDNPCTFKSLLARIESHPVTLDSASISDKSNPVVLFAKAVLPPFIYKGIRSLGRRALGH